MTDFQETHYKCGGILVWKEYPQTIRLRANQVHFVDEPDWLARCSECGLVGIPVALFSKDS